jgi:hypothetical protein
MRHEPGAALVLHAREREAAVPRPAPRPQLARERGVAVAQGEHLARVAVVALDEGEVGEARHEHREQRLGALAQADPRLDGDGDLGQELGALAGLGRARAQRLLGVEEPGALDRLRAEARERLELFAARVVERLLTREREHDGADHALGGRERHDGAGRADLPVDAPHAREARAHGLEVREVDGLGRPHDVRGRHVGVDRKAVAEVVDQARGVADVLADVEQPVLAEQHDGAGRRPQRAPGVLDDRGGHRGDVVRRRQRGGERLQGGDAPRLVLRRPPRGALGLEQPRTLERDRALGRDRAREHEEVVVERPLLGERDPERADGGLVDLDRDRRVSRALEAAAGQVRVALEQLVAPAEQHGDAPRPRVARRQRDAVVERLRERRLVPRRVAGGAGDADAALLVGEEHADRARRQRGARALEDRLDDGALVGRRREPARDHAEHLEPCARRRVRRAKLLGLLLQPHEPAVPLLPVADERERPARERPPEGGDDRRAERAEGRDQHGDDREEAVLRVLHVPRPALGVAEHGVRADAEGVEDLLAAVDPRAGVCETRRPLSSELELAGEERVEPSALGEERPDESGQSGVAARGVLERRDVAALACLPEVVRLQARRAPGDQEAAHARLLVQQVDEQSAAGVAERDRVAHVAALGAVVQVARDQVRADGERADDEEEHCERAAQRGA